MSKGGVYVWRDGKAVKISDRTHTFFDAYVPEGGYMDETLGYSKDGAWQPAHITSREQKAILMREKNVVEDGGFQKVKKTMYFV